jgi:uncharacterized LabA/DUF88 family protein
MGQQNQEPTNTQAEPWPIQAIAHSQLLRPFSGKRLTLALYNVEQSGVQIADARQRLLIEMPTDPDVWAHRLTEIMNSLATLAEQCEDAWERIDLLVKSADVDYERALDAMVCVLRGVGNPGLRLVEGEAA